MDDYQDDTRYAEDMEMDGDEYGPYDDGPEGDFEYQDGYQDDAADFEARELSYDLEMD
ncbi:hypothetical protein KLP40_14485 [Hymenobacter sp. NST-14]|uniref:hypothetical protein n=1 Tax=Hymenobacter piscis TaxID=2839984 RepID=UPI001C03879C|nr:hypothetical protein [Hymenobacter piscis]MBT9394375.1 hypothetical protein [Hymenobacter piscis]